MLALGRLSIAPNQHPLSFLITPKARENISEAAWPCFASLSWAVVMYIFRWHPEVIQNSLRSSMTYMYVSAYLRLTLRYMLRLKLTRTIDMWTLIPSILSIHCLFEISKEDQQRHHCIYIGTK